jgi:hypothetical protein
MNIKTEIIIHECSGVKGTKKGIIFLPVCIWMGGYVSVCVSVCP